ncbi:MAG: YqaA family protein [Janthinobacterium lividum]
MKFFRPLLTFIFHLGYFGPLVMGVLDSSFLFLPFGNDLVVVGLVAQTRHNVWIYVLSAAVGSTIGAFLLAIVARKIGESGVRKMVGDKQFNRLCSWIKGHGALSILAGGLAPPPFPYTIVIAAAGALEYPISRILVMNFIARAIRFTLLALLALKFGKEVIEISQSAPFRWTMVGFVILCFVGSGFSIWKWLRRRR